MDLADRLSGPGDAHDHLAITRRETHGLLPVRAPLPGVDHARRHQIQGPKKLANSATEWLYTRVAPAE